MSQAGQERPPRQSPKRRGGSAPVTRSLRVDANGRVVRDPEDDRARDRDVPADTMSLADLLPESASIDLVAAIRAAADTGNAQVLEFALPSAAGVPRATGAAPARGATRTSAREQTANEQTGREDDAVLRRAWRKLSAEERLDLALWFTAEARALDTFQETLLQFVVRRPERDPYDWPESADHGPLYASREHSPAQVFRRRPLSPLSRPTGSHTL